jgi:uncharacterized delta-60 repeat protein
LITQYKKDGKIDHQFGNDGKVFSSLSGFTDKAYDLVLQPDGKIVAGGEANYDFAVARFHENGSVDSSFGTAGKLIVDINGTSNARIESLVLQADGKIVSGGTVWPYPASNDFALVRFNANGSLDNSFSSDGKVTTSIGSSGDYISELLLQPDGKIIAAGTSFSSGSGNFALARYYSGSECLFPSGINAVQVAANQAKIKWNASTGATGYNIQYKQVGTGNWISKSATATNVVLNNLQPSTTYKYQVATVCANSTSTFSTIKSFTTPPMKVGRRLERSGGNAGVSQSIKRNI